MEAFAFEHLAKRLLEKMGYHVEVTTGAVIADIELGITSVVRLLNATDDLQRKELDALRGSLYRFNGRGTIIDFPVRGKEVAFERGSHSLTRQAH